MAFPDLYGFGASDIRGSLVKVNGNVTVAAKPASHSSFFIVSPYSKHARWCGGGREVFEAFDDAVWQTGMCVRLCGREAAVGEDPEAAACTTFAQEVQHHLQERSEQLRPAPQVLAEERNSVRWRSAVRQRPSMDFHMGYARIDRLALFPGT